MFGLVWSGVALLAAEGLRSRDEVMRLLRMVVVAGSFSAAVALMQSPRMLQVAPVPHAQAHATSVGSPAR